MYWFYHLSNLLFVSIVPVDQDLGKFVILTKHVVSSFNHNFTVPQHFFTIRKKDELEVSYFHEFECISIKLNVNYNHYFLKGDHVQK